MQIDSCFCIEDFQFRVSLVSEDASVLEKTAFPFSVVTDNDPLTRLIEAGLVTGAGSEADKFFLLVQRDRYLMTEDEMRPVTNRDIEESWRNAFSYYRAEDSGLILLSGQTDEGGGLVPFPPQFFCKARRIFFHPPCPKCGLPLRQCEDDELLEASGLRPYSGSLKRYLYCAQCASAGRGEFYAYEEEPPAPPAVRDRSALIRKFRLLAEGGKDAGRLPCLQCPEHRECYGTEQRAVARITPFSFYPFYMFIFRAMSLNALDFLPLVSGAGFQDVESVLEKRQETGRISRLRDIRGGNNPERPRFLFDSDRRFFLEVLYLKLCFLGEVLRSLGAGSDLFRHPGLRPSLGSIWVSLPAHGGLLPFLWNFRVNLMGIFSPPPGSGLFYEPEGPESLFYTGLVWFNALLANSRQDVSRVNTSLMGIMDHCRKDNDFSFQGAEMRDPVFSPVNIFWEPEGKTVSEDFIPLWDKALELSWSLLRAGFAPEPSFSMENFRRLSEDLGKEVRSLLFTEVPAETAAAPAREDEAVYGILREICNKWSAGAVTEEKESTETVILSSRGREKEPPPAAPPEQEEAEVIEETVIISRQDAGPSPGPERPAEDEKQGGGTDGGDFPEETVIIRKSTGHGDKGKDGTK